MGEAGFEKLEGAADCKSLLKKHLTKEVFDKTKDLTTPSFGSSLVDVIQSGVANLDSGVGIYAPDAEAYSTFSALFDPVIDTYHKGFTAQRRRSLPPGSKCLQVLANRKRNLPQRQQNLLGLGWGGGSHSHHLYAEGWRPW